MLITEFIMTYFRKNQGDRVLAEPLVSRGLAVIVAGLLLGFAGQARANIINAVSALQTDISNALMSAKSGDTVMVPPGTTYWTTTLNITAGITIAGSGSNSSIVVDEVPRTGSYAAFVNAVLTSNENFRITGFTFRVGVTNTTFGENGFIRIGGTCPSVRLDHCYFDLLDQAQTVKIYGQLYGVIDHCTWTMSPKQQCLLIWHDGWGGGNNAYGDGSWADQSYFGSSKFMFIEDNVFDNSANNVDNGVIDCYGGGRMVVRHNNFINCRPNTHGTESSHRVRGYRAAEIYWNTESISFGTSGGQFRGGTAVQFSNTMTGLFNGDRVLTVYREFSTFPPWGAASGFNPWDVNDPNGVYASGVHAGTNNSSVLIDPTANWTANQWVGYTMNNMSAWSDGRSASNQCSGYILSNTSNSVTFVQDVTFLNGMTFNTGDSYAIYRVITALDQCGRGGGTLVSGGSGTAAPTPTGWTQEVSDPVYCWGDTLNGQPVGVTCPYPTVVEGRDFFNTPKPGYIPYTYPHPLVTSGGLVAPTGFHQTASGS
jgi:hypothetical protein